MHIIQTCIYWTEYYWTSPDITYGRPVTRSVFHQLCLKAGAATTHRSLFSRLIPGIPYSHLRIPAQGRRFQKTAADIYPSDLTGGGCPTLLVWKMDMTLLGVVGQFLCVLLRSISVHAKSYPLCADLDVFPGPILALLNRLENCTHTNTRYICAGYGAYAQVETLQHGGFSTACSSVALVLSVIRRPKTWSSGLGSSCNAKGFSVADAYIDPKEAERVWHRNVHSPPTRLVFPVRDPFQGNHSPQGLSRQTGSLFGPRAFSSSAMAFSPPRRSPPSPDLDPSVSLRCDTQCE